MGSGFEPGDTAVLGSNGKRRVVVATEAVLDGRARAIITTGSLRHPNGRYFAMVAKDVALSTEVPYYKTLVHPQPEKFSTDTLGDLLQAISVGRREGFNQYLICTERPHYFQVFLLRWLKFRRFRGVSIRFLQSGNPVSLSYWIRSLVAGALAILPPKAYEKIDAAYHSLTSNRRRGGP